MHGGIEENHGFQTLTGKIFGVGCGRLSLCLGDETSGRLSAQGFGKSGLAQPKLGAHPGLSSPTMELQGVLFLGKEETKSGSKQGRPVSASPGPQGLQLLAEGGFEVAPS